MTGWVITLLALSVAFLAILAMDARAYVADSTLLLALPYAIIFVMTAGWIAAYSLGPNPRR
jgi:hypothetical protein